MKTTRKAGLLLLLLLLTMTTAAQEPLRKQKYKGEPGYIYRLYLRDKQANSYSLEHPSRWLSRKSLERRKRQGLALDSTDLPVSPRYLRLINRRSAQVIGTSRWNNTVLVRVTDSASIDPLKALDCVSGVRRVWAAPDSVSPTAVKTKYHEHFETWDSLPDRIYGTAQEQIEALHGDRLHRANLMGQGMTIAILDGGFKNVDHIPAFQRVDIRGTRDFVCPPSPSIFHETDHGTKVLSTMALRQPYYYVGTAPEAAYWLLRCEDQQTEQEVEEDYWAMAVEFADSVGADVINSSLGYHVFDDASTSHHLWQLDGHTALISRTASMVAQKGMILVNSAGNSGMGPWKKIGVPADADNILTVGALSPSAGTIAPFSSVGPSQDGRVKPDVVATGAPAAVVSGRGTITEAMGTSFAAPIVCGLTACLWQGLRDKTALEVMELIRQSGNNVQHPDNIYGYGQPDFGWAYMAGNMKK